MENVFLQEAKALAPYMEEIFYHLHRHPELSSQEYETQKFILAELEKLGIEAEKVADTGVVGIIRGGKPGKTVGFRADMDALPLLEETDLPYKSENDGVMHACGHDSHMTILLGFAKMMVARKAELTGNIKLFFQPAEEKNGGARRMIAGGCLENPQVDGVFFSHCTGGYPLGQIKAKYGSVSAASNAFFVTVKGKSCHGAYPHRGIDPIAAACQMVTAIQTIVSRRTSAADSVVVTVGSIQGGTAPNIVAEEVKFSGTIRTLNPTCRQQAVDSFRQIVTGIAQAMNVEVDIFMKEGYAATVNNEDMVDLVRAAGAKVLGTENVLTKSEVTMGAEDFAYFCEAVPGCYFSFGIAAPGQPQAPAHNPKFKLDPQALPYGAAVYAQIAMDFLKED